MTCFSTTCAILPSTISAKLFLLSLDLNKREYTYDEVMLLYNNMYNSNKLNNLDSNYILYLIISIFICILLYFIYKKNNL